MDPADAIRGTPPRRRGGHQLADQVLGQSRNTPTPAGRTLPYELPEVSMPELPPRRRGGPVDHLPVRRHPRNTPTSAGRTPRSSCRAPPSPEHPHVGGEDLLESAEPGKTDGTPPRRRGGLCDLHGATAMDRNTPTSAGRTWTIFSGLLLMAEHPHVGGEDPRWVESSAAVCGTPPRRRGGHHLDARLPRSTRNTPTSAGRTPRPPPARTPRSEHPHVGGEDSGSGRWSC